MKLISSAFKNGETIPQKYGRDFENINPPLSVAEVPGETKSLALFMEDPDLPKNAPVEVWDHWIVFNMTPDLREIPEAWNVEGVRGRGTRGELEYGGPRPPDREHRYFFTLYALDKILELVEGASKQEVIDAMGGHILAQVKLMGLFAPPLRVE